VTKSKLVLPDTELRKELSRVSNKAFKLEKMNNVLRLKLEGFEKGCSIEDSKGREKVEFLQDLVEERNRQVKELWNVIQMLDDENMSLKSRLEKFEQRESLLNKEIIDLKVSIANDNPRADITVSYNSADWKKILDEELSTWETQTLKVHRKIYQCNKNISGRRGWMSQRNMKKSSKLT